MTPRISDGLPSRTQWVTSRSSLANASIGSPPESFGLLHFAAGVEQRWFAQIPPFSADHGEVEHERRLLQMDFETVRERPALLVDRTARGRDGELPIGEPKLRVPELGQIAAHTATRNHFLRHAEYEADEVSIVDVQVEHRAADKIGRPKIPHPSRIGNDAAKCAAAHSTEFAAADYVESPVVFGEEWQHVAHH